MTQTFTALLWLLICQVPTEPASADDTVDLNQSAPAERPLKGQGKPEQSSVAVPGGALYQLYDVLMIRHAGNGKAYGANEIAPMIFKHSEFPFDDATYPRFTAALDAIMLQDIESYSVMQRAVLQRQIWPVFDATTRSRFLTRRSHEERRNAVHKQLADLIRRLALKRSEIESLPDPLLKTVNAKKYPIKFDFGKPKSPFLPADLTAAPSAWVCFSRESNSASFHAMDSRWRSAFFQFIRLPAGRQATIKHFDQWSKHKVFPVGTQVALVEKAFLVSSLGEIVLSPMTVSVQFRAYANVDKVLVKRTMPRSALRNSSRALGTTCEETRS